MIDPLLSRAAPADDPLTRFFWSSGADGLLRILRCGACGYYTHPPTSRCPRCLAVEVAPAAVSGRGTVHTFTINVQEWTPGQQPYVYAVVELPEQEGLRLTSNVVGVAPEEVHIGMPVRVVFVERHGSHYPLFTPDGPA
ncbi:Zn-ribbon domain-containing OB-fold protein [Pseudonocardia sp. GCM10023141]|uniref:Zn-ribbon domain-containing OB-fold protein n=1 Tax=Pseudonocardia sp. GCM10023141 TaxID=3252653 RepID=UPI00361FADC9